MISKHRWLMKIAILLVAAAIAIGCGSSGDDTSTRSTSDDDETNAPVPVSQVTIDAVSNDAADNFVNKIASSSYSDAVSGTVHFLKSQSSVNDAVQVDSAIAVSWKNGSKSYILTEGKYGIKSKHYKSHQKVASDRFIGTAVQLEFAAVAPQNKKAAIFCPLKTEFDLDYSDVKQTLSGIGYTVVEYYDEDASVAAFEAIMVGNYGVIIVDAHTLMDKNEQVAAILTGEVISENIPISSRSSRLDGCIARSLVSWYDFPERSKYAIRSNFFNVADLKFDNSVIYLNGCKTTKYAYFTTDSLLNSTYHASVPSAVIGYKDTINADLTMPATNILFRALATRDNALPNAISSTKNDSSLIAIHKQHPLSGASYNIALLDYNFRPPDLDKESLQAR